jgi:group I intron endonuclease
MIGIYKIQSLLKSGRCYIGSAINLGKRWHLHLFELRHNKHHSRKLQNHVNKYGIDDLRFSILLGCDKDDLIANEQYFIDSYNPYFNICKIAGNVTGRKFSIESRNKIDVLIEDLKSGSR